MSEHQTESPSLAGHSENAPRTPRGATARRARYRAPLITAAPHLGAPWLAIWIRPRAVIRALLERPRPVSAWVIIIAATSLDGFDTILTSPFGARVAVWKAALMALCLGLVIGVAGAWIVGLLLRVFGAWFGGRGTYSQLRAVVCWVSLPSLLFSAAMWAATLAVYGADVFRNPPDMNISYGGAFRSPALFAAALALQIWIMVIVVRATAEAHQFSSWRAVGAAAVAFVTAVGLFIVGLLVTLFGIALKSALG